MTEAPWQGRLLTLDEFDALPEDNSRRYELEEGILVVSPRPTKPLPALDVLIVAEIVSPGSRRKDTLVKPLEYAEAGIPHYRVIDLEPPASLTAYVLVDGHYQESQTVTGEFVTGEPFALRFAVPALVTPRGRTETGRWQASDQPAKPARLAAARPGRLCRCT